jgi:hypothetical protein
MYTLKAILPHFGETIQTFLHRLHSLEQALHQLLRTCWSPGSIECELLVIFCNPAFSVRSLDGSVIWSSKPLVVNRQIHAWLVLGNCKGCRQIQIIGLMA